MQITKNTWNVLKENGLDPVKIGNGVTYSMVIDYIRDNYNIIIDVRYSPQIVMLPQWHCNIYKSNNVRFFLKVPAACNSYDEMAESAIKFIAKTLKLS